MRKSSLAVAFLLLASTSIFGIAITPSVRATTLYVGGAGPGNYSAIQDAIDAAVPGDTVFVFNGTYYERLVVHKSINLVGEDRATTILDGGGSGSVVTIERDHVSISGLSITNSGKTSLDAGIGVSNQEYAHLLNVELHGNSHGVVFANADESTIEQSYVHDNYDFGIHLDSSSKVTVSNNLLVYNTIGIQLTWSSRFNRIINNLAASNAAGIGLGGTLGDAPDENTIEDNTIQGNGQGIYFIYSEWNTAKHNDFIENDVQAIEYYEYPLYGLVNFMDYNYWSDYTGTDDNGDGIGDKLFCVYSVDCVLALMYPRGTHFARPPEDLRANLTGSGFRNVTLSWALSPDDGNGFRPVVEYGLYRSSVYDRRGKGYAQLARVPAGASQYSDSSAGEGDPESYFYRVCAVGLAGNSACTSSQAYKFTRPLESGPNLVSLPLIPSNESIETVFQTVKHDKIWHYDSSSQQWSWHMRGKTYSRNLLSVDYTMGIWVHVTEASNFTIAGFVITQTTTHQTTTYLHEGWNLVGFPSLNTTYTVADLRAETGATRVEGYDSAPPYFLRVLGDAEALQAGQGYWVRVEADTVWTVSFA